jgi:C1A family cysteine protease
LLITRFSPEHGSGTMIPLMRLVLITGLVSVILITSCLFGQNIVQEQDLSPVSPAPTMVVLATSAWPLALEADARTGAIPGQGGVAADATTRQLAEVSEKLQHLLALGRPKGLAKWIAGVGENKKYRIGYTPLGDRILAEGIAARQIARNDAQSLSDSSLNAALNGILEQDVATIINARFANLTGLKVPEDKAALEKHIKQQNDKAQKVLAPLRQAPPTLFLTPIRVPSKDLSAFNWTLPGYSANSTGIVTAVQNQDQFNNCQPGSCWAFATVGAFEAAYAKANGVFIGASEQYLLNCAQPVLSRNSDPILAGQPWSCAGGWWAFPMLSASDVSDPGLPRRVDLPFTGVPAGCPTINKPYQATTWGYVTNGLNIPTNDQLKDALCTYGPLTVAIFGETTWIFNEGDVISDQPNDTTNPKVNHAVVLVGWDDVKSAWIIKNSWGTGYGIPANGVGTGFLYIAYNSNNLGYSAAYVVAAAPAN